MINHSKNASKKRDRERVIRIGVRTFFCKTWEHDKSKKKKKQKKKKKKKNLTEGGEIKREKVSRYRHGSRVVYYEHG